MICNEFDVLLSYFKIVLEPKFATPPSFVVQALVVVVFFHCFVVADDLSPLPEVKLSLH